MQHQTPGLTAVQEKPDSGPMLIAERVPECPPVSVLIVNTNELSHLKRCLQSVSRQTYPNYEVIVIDNCSTDGSVEYVRATFPEVRIEESAENLGYPGANNHGMSVAHGEYFAVLNPDTVVAENWLEELVRALESNPAAGLATSKILLQGDPTRINACGNIISITGLTFCRGVGQQESEYPSPEPVAAVSGCSFVIRRSIVEEIGPFDPAFVSYLEETDLSLRALLAGHTSLYVPASQLVHDYRFRFNEKKCFHIEKNRIYMLLKILRWRTLISLAPSLVFAEVLVWAYTAKSGRGFVRQKLQSYQWLWNNRRQILAARRAIQARRIVSDRAVLDLLSPELPINQIANGFLASALQRLTTLVLSVNWKLTAYVVN